MSAGGAAIAAGASGKTAGIAGGAAGGIPGAITGGLTGGSGTAGGMGGSAGGIGSTRARGMINSLSSSIYSSRPTTFASSAALRTRITNSIFCL